MSSRRLPRKLHNEGEGPDMTIEEYGVVIKELFTQSSLVEFGFLNFSEFKDFWLLCCEASDAQSIVRAIKDDESEFIITDVWNGFVNGDNLVSW